MTSSHTSVSVSLGDRSYEIVVGEGLASTMSEALSATISGKRCAVVTDESVAALHLAPFQAMLKSLGIDAETIILPAGESTKSFANLERVSSNLLDLKLTRRDIVIALGGGVIGDLTGFAASIVRRGIDFIQVPTTLLAQVDSSVGGKTAINAPQGKNLIGAFYQPRLVLIDTNVLKTLPQREIMAGFAEVIKYGLINDMPFFNWLADNGKKVLGLEPDAAREAISRSCQNKADVVAADERETGNRALLNLGHTFGHAIEAHGQYDGRVLHGEAVSVGMVMAHQVSHALGLMPREDLERVLTTFKGLGMPMTVGAFGFNGLTAEEMVRHMGQDKKNVDSRVTLILSKGIGKAFLTRDIAQDDLTRMLTGILKMERASAL